MTVDIARAHSPSVTVKPRSYSQEDLSCYNLLDTPIWVFDIENKAMWWANEAACEVWNASSVEELLSRSYEDMSEATASRLQDYLARFREGEKIHDSWTYYPNGTPKTVFVRHSGIYIEEGRMALLNHGDVSEIREEADEIALRGVEMLRHLPVAVGQFDVEGRLMHQNPESLKVFGSEILSDQQPLCAFVRRFLDVQLGRRILQQVKDGRDVSIEAMQHTMSHGPRWFAIECRKSRDPIVKDQPIIICSARDITELVKAKKEADEANQQKSEFIAVMGHEIRTPLHQVLGFIELLAHTKLNAEQQDFINLLQNATVSLMTIINDLLDFTKLEAGKMKLEDIPFEPRGLLQGTLQVIAPKAEAKCLKLTTDIDETIPQRLVGDPNRLRQILLNLLQNAVKFTHNGGIKLTVKLDTSATTTASVVSQDNSKQQQVLHAKSNSAWKDHEGAAVSQSMDSDCIRVRFAVVDTGIGINREQREHIFEKYQQANASVARNYGGTGLGLSICQHLSEAMGGSIGVESVEGEGSEFWFELPFGLSTGNARVDTVDTTTISRASELRILVAEDNKVNQKLIVKMLKRMGHQVTVADNGRLAVGEVERCKGNFDLILMDVQMPVLDGIGATKEIRSKGWTARRLPIVGLTASYQTSDRAQYLDMGMNDCIGKPVRMTQLKEVLNELCDKGAPRIDRVQAGPMKPLFGEVAASNTTAKDKSSGMGRLQPNTDAKIRIKRDVGEKRRVPSYGVPDRGAEAPFEATNHQRHSQGLMGECLELSSKRRASSICTVSSSGTEISSNVTRKKRPHQVMSDAQYQATKRRVSVSGVSELNVDNTRASASDGK